MNLNECKFRCWLKQFGCMMEVTDIVFGRDLTPMHIRGNAVINGKRQPLGGHAHHIDLDEHMELLRFTGATDMSMDETDPESRGEEIYEDDIIMGIDGKPRHVYFAEDEYCWCAGDKQLHDVGWPMKLGNIHEHPELLEDE